MDEECDGGDLGGMDCAGLGYSGGDLGCTLDCTYDTSRCTGGAECGNGVVEDMEECDGDDLGGMDCVRLGYSGGDLGCLPDCTYDTSRCTGGAECGNGVVEDMEECDGSDLRGMDCMDLGFDRGSLGCSSDCTYDTSRCSICGNGLIEVGEECDGTDFGGRECADVGNYDGGELACWSDCRLDTRGCTLCGDGIAEGSEECDGTDLQGKDCTDFGFEAGDLGCSASCGYDTSRCRLCGNGILEPGEACDDGNLEPWDGCDSCLPSDFLVNTYTMDDQSMPSVGIAPDGRFVVVWRSLGQDGEGHGVFGQRFDAEGRPVGREFQVNTYTTGNQRGGYVAVGPDARFVVVWHSEGQDGDAWGIYGQRFQADGTMDGTEFRVNTTTRSWQIEPVAGYDASGRFVVAWRSYMQDEPGVFASGVYCRLFDAIGSPRTGEILVNQTVAHSQFWPRLGVQSSGNFMAVWVSGFQDDDGSAGVYRRHFDANGTPLISECQVNLVDQGTQTHPDVAVDAAGNFVVVWEDDTQEGDGWGIYGQRIDANGGGVDWNFLVNDTTTGDQRFPKVAMDAAGNFVVVWQHTEGVTGVTEVRAKVFLPDGNVAVPEFRVNETPATEAARPDVAAADDGRFVVCWHDDAIDGDVTGIACALYDPQGNKRAPGNW